MEGFALPDKIILLFDYYSPESCLLHESFLQTGCDCIAVSLEENDFLPRNVFSVYDLLSRECKIEDENRGKPRFFNEIAVPDNWSIQAGDSISGKNGAGIPLSHSNGGGEMAPGDRVRRILYPRTGTWEKRS